MLPALVGWILPLAPEGDRRSGSAGVLDGERTSQVQLLAADDGRVRTEHPRGAGGGQARRGAPELPVFTSRRPSSRQRSPGQRGGGDDGEGWQRLLRCDARVRQERGKNRGKRGWRAAWGRSVVPAVALALQCLLFLLLLLETPASSASPGVTPQHPSPCPGGPCLSRCGRAPLAAWLQLAEGINQLITPPADGWAQAVGGGQPAELMKPGTGRGVPAVTPGRWGDRPPPGLRRAPRFGLVSMPGARGVGTMGAGASSPHPRDSGEVWGRRRLLGDA